MTVFYVDSSVVLRALLWDSPATVEWFNLQRAVGNKLVASRIGELEVTRVAFNTKISREDLENYTLRFAYTPVDDQLITEALALNVVVKAADGLHLVAALRLGTDKVVFVTHDSQLANAAKQLGFRVLDPVTDDPGRLPVA